MKTRLEAMRNLGRVVAEVAAVTSQLTPLEAAQRAWRPDGPTVEVLAAQRAWRPDGPTVEVLAAQIADGRERTAAWRRSDDVAARVLEDLTIQDHDAASCRGNEVATLDENHAAPTATDETQDH
ncbi:hypothetical protein [Microbacterium maritypicum]